LQAVFLKRKTYIIEKTFAPTARYTTIRSLVSFVATMGWNIHRMDVKTTFLNGTTGEEVYIGQLEGFGINSKYTHVCRLKKVLYGLKQAPRAWYVRMDAYLLRIGFIKNTVNPNLYKKLWIMSQSLFYYMWMIYSLQVWRETYKNVRRC